MDVKKIEIDVCFVDGFSPPERFEKPTVKNGYKSRCKKCPFFGWYEDYADGWCNVPSTRDADEECPIKKFFV